MIKNRNLGFRFIACCGFNEPDVNGEKSTASEHLNQLHWAQTYPEGMGKKGTQVSQVPFDLSPTRSCTLRDIELDVVIARDCYVKESHQGCAKQRGRPIFVVIIECPTICR